DRDSLVVLRGGTNHRRAADIDILDRVLERRIRPRYDALERIQIHRDHVDRRDRMRGERIVVDAATSEQAAVDLRVQRLDAPVHDLGKPRDLRDLGDGQRRVAKRSRRASGRDQLERQIEQSSCELDDPALVGNAQQCTTIRLHHETSIADELVALQLLAQGTAIDAENLRRAALVAVRIGQDRLEKWLLYLTDDELIQIAGLVSVQALEIALQRLIRERAERF